MSRGRLYFPLLVLFIAATLGFAWLGTWQVERRAWKLDLVARVDARIHAPATPAPGPDRWTNISAANDEYRHVSISGNFLHEKRTLVQASTELGTGYWVLTPMQLPDGNLVLINRGFVATAAPTEKPANSQTITGLLRLSEADGRALRRNDPAAQRWFSRDVAAIAAAQGLTPERVAPYFIDADAEQDAPPGAPVAGLTVVSFYNHHLVYIFTWYTLALMSAAAALYLFRQGRRSRN